MRQNVRLEMESMGNVVRAHNIVYRGDGNSPNLYSLKNEPQS